ncbi:multiheme c-type cytochrome [Arcobacter sp. LA11]|uniref:multiheme c-type cytochrome n=1 Tax=Arcobacter sp. LA11 TaxID=1898176 RepID=UPI0009FABD97|nr:multiheme c-type cytochrome [Arcobacter sp. LA11]
MKTIWIEISIIIMFITGILQWDILDIQWEYFALVQAVHIITSIIVSVVLIIPFVNMHTYKYRKNIVAKRRNSGNGMFLGIVLLLVTISGFYLFFIGNRGGDEWGVYSFNIHLYGSFLLVFFLWYHSMFSNANIRRKNKAKEYRLKRQGLVASIAILAFLIPTLSYSSQSSSALYLTKDTKYIYSANLDGGSVSKIDAKTGDKIFEKVLGKDIRRIAFNDDESVYAVTDFMKNRVYFLNSNNEIIKTINTNNRPHGIVYDKQNKYFFVSIYEDNELLIIDDKTFEVLNTIKTDKTPRGLALTDDGRLLVSHAMIGMVSIYDSRSLARLKTITLHSTHNDDEFVSQGKPRLLDDIEIKPNGKEAWLPHVLWNFDHKFQFQSTIFPTVSIISLEKGLEKELAQKRKHLFKSINVQDNNNRTMIVSNPWDLAFSKDGAKAFVTLAGSEDVMVLNIGRSTGNAKKKRHRKRGNRSGKGAKVTQILRAYPNETNPQALITHPTNNNIYVQNAASLDMTLLDSGGSHPFARVTVQKDSFSKVVENDPLSKKLRLGKTLFNNANTNTHKDIPMAGDFWMSCNSCHFEGFNFTNGFLFADTKLDKKEDASIGHDNVDKGYISKTPLADYVRIARDTQGGMGADEKAELTPADPEKMSKKLKENMDALHDYVTAKENLRYLSSWIKLEDEVEKYHVEDWTNSAKCKSCHSEIFNQWADSNHKNLVGTNPYYLVVENIAAQTEGEEFRKWCMSCHNPSAITTGLVDKTTPTMDKFFESGAKTLIEELKVHGNTKLEEGVSCVACHRITKIEDAGGNAAYTLNLTERQKYTFEDTNNEAAQWLSEKFINSKPEAHIKSYMKPVYKDSVYCASCHDEFTPGSGSKIVSTFKEWENSPFNNPSDPTKHKSCIDCHMTYLKDDQLSPLRGRSTDGGKIKDDVKVHYFAGSNHFLSGLKSSEHEDQTLQLLRTSAQLDVNIDGTKIDVGVKNVGAGHHLPTGVADFRELWLDITVKDRTGKVVFESGKLKEDGNLGEDARPFMKVFGDKDGKPVGLLFWRYEKLLSDTRIKAGERRVESYEIKIDEGEELLYPLTAIVKLNFRIYPQWVTSAVQKAYPQLPNPPVVELEKIIQEFN